MKLIGIDYGTKRVGVAASDTEGTMAFPKMIIPNDRALLPTLVSFIRAENAEALVVGESKNLSGEDNVVTAEIRRFVEALERECDIPVHFEPEFYTSHEARRLSEDVPSKGKEGAVDAKAAAIILNSYIQRQ